VGTRRANPMCRIKCIDNECARMHFCITVSTQVADVLLWAHKSVARIQWQGYHTLVPPRAANGKPTGRGAVQGAGYGPRCRPRGAVAARAPDRNGGGSKVAAGPAAAARVAALCRHNGRPGVLDLLRALVLGSLRRHVFGLLVVKL
jgi:hypothetical protein